MAKPERSDQLVGTVQQGSPAKMVPLAQLALWASLDPLGLMVHLAKMVNRVQLASQDHLDMLVNRVQSGPQVLQAQTVSQGNQVRLARQVGMEQLVSLV
jgi:hypothetical protein